jgi:hypothetical protein
MSFPQAFKADSTIIIGFIGLVMVIIEQAGGLHSGHTNKYN